MKTLPLFILLTVIAGCQINPPSEKNSSAKNTFSGVYINTRTHTDTINFNRFKDSPNFLFTRGYDTLDHGIQSKSQVGFYRFDVHNDKIRLQWSFSSIIDTTSYHFEMRKDTLLSGNFFEEAREGEVEVFVKLK